MTHCLVYHSLSFREVWRVKMILSGYCFVAWLSGMIFGISPKMLIPIDAIIITSHDHSRPETDKEPDFFMHRFKVNVLMLAFRQFAAGTWQFQISRQIKKTAHQNSG